MTISSSAGLHDYRVQKWWCHIFFFVCISAFEYHVLVEHDEKHPQFKFSGNQFKGPEIWPHDYLISSKEYQCKSDWLIAVWNQDNLHWFQWGYLYSCMWPYLRPPWTNSCQIWCVRVFHHVLLKYGHENTETQKTRKFDDVTLRYFISSSTGCMSLGNSSMIWFTKKQHWIPVLGQKITLNFNLNS